MNLVPVAAISGWPAYVLAAVLALLPFSFHAERHLETATRIEGSEAGKCRAGVGHPFSFALR